MMVTFVSQCQKKALNRTRRVLDAFANRIGDNTWQTIITQEGLQAVKKLLRKTATKNTAVSCHWIRSRSRSELVWVVGNRNEFNSQGVVPVNHTSKEIPMDVDNYKPDKKIAYANSHYQRLDEHLFAVGYVATAFYDALIEAPESNHKKMIWLAALLHDLGKIDPIFQKWVIDPKNKHFQADDGQHVEGTKFSFDKHPRHNEISALIFKVLNSEANNKTLNPLIAHISHVIYWHHASPYRKMAEKFDRYDKLSDIFFSNNKKLSPKPFFVQVLNIVKQVDDISLAYDSSLLSIINTLSWQELDADFDEYYTASAESIPLFKEYQKGNTTLDIRDVDTAETRKEIGRNGLNNLLRTCVITADRLVSGLSRLELSTHIKNKTLARLVDNHIKPDSNLDSEITESLSLGFYDEARNKVQAEAAKKLARKESVSVLSGAAGCGKTKIALEWAAHKKAKKLIWICPRVQVCQGIFTELTEQYLPNSEIEIYTGEYKFINTWSNPTPQDEQLTGDVIITTIDQVLNAVISHTKVDFLIDYLNAQVVFDEFHEYTNMQAFNLLFAELIRVKQLQSNHSTLLVSATPNPYFLENVLNLDLAEVVEVPSFNQCLYQIQFVSYDEVNRDDSNPLYAPQPEQTFVISNTAKTAQISYILNQANENSVLFHSKFKPSDKKLLFNEVYESFKKEGNHQYDILRSGPIVQASLNISSKNMVTEITSPENILQRLGRLDRFGENHSGVNLLKVAVPDTLMEGKGVGRCARFLARNNLYQTTKQWLNYLQDNLIEQPITLSEIYTLYNAFYQDPLSEKSLETDLKSALKNSIELTNKKVTDPRKVMSKPKEKGEAMKISNRSLRGDNVFVQMAVCNLNDWQSPQILNRYAYSNPIDDKHAIDAITDSFSKLQNDDLINHAAKKQVQIDKTHPAFGIKANQMKNREKVIESAARDSDYPIYVSYTPDDLTLLGGESAQHQHAIFYCECEKQPIGALAINLLINQKDDNDD
jgi:CRISPR-associated endonuclease/helicase Cas3